MSVLIKDMKMPESCAGCPIDSDSCELWTQLPVTLLNKVRQEDCPLIEVSEDVQSVKHGRWIKARGSWCTPGGDPVWECSECGKGLHVYGIEHGAYGSDVADGQWVACPNCGARMDR